MKNTTTHFITYIVQECDLKEESTDPPKKVMAHGELNQTKN